jgi:hypothetical protein
MTEGVQHPFRVVQHAAGYAEAVGDFPQRPQKFRSGRARALLGVR